MDDLVELLTVTDRFELSSGLVVVPDFSLPDGWKVRSETVTLLMSDGTHCEATAQLVITHFNIRDPAVPQDRRWRLVVSFPALKKGDLPIGTKVMVPRSLREAIEDRRERP
jgi:hypothetical protein